MVLSVRNKLKIFAAVLIVIIVAAACAAAYVNLYMKTPEYTLKAVQEAVYDHDTDTFNKYVDTDSVVAGVTSNMLDGIIAAQSNLPDEAKATMNSLATMFKAPLTASLESGLKTFVQTGSWTSGDLTQDSQGAMINSDMILEQAGLTNLEFIGIDSVEEDENAKAAHAAVRVKQAEIDQEFVFNVTLEQQQDGYWKVVSIDNFGDYIKTLESGRRDYIKKYLEDTALLMIDKEKTLAESEAHFESSLSTGALGSDASRAELKALIDDTIVPQLKDTQAALQAVDVPKAAEALHNLRLKSYESKIDYYENYAKWLDDKDIKSLRAATDSLKKAKTMESEADLLAKRIQAQVN